MPNGIWCEGPHKIYCQHKRELAGRKRQAFDNSYLEQAAGFTFLAALAVGKVISFVLRTAFMLGVPRETRLRGNVNIRMIHGERTGHHKGLRRSRYGKCKTQNKYNKKPGI
ncbi:hypothetical protein DQ400_18975 [Vreelandella sulfidaeris]|mgnify:FL=1|uniref:Uncharacterized protein n=1 Tax=Vreelandella sulfidaeris TaxID=115553 RepID=A0A365TIA2_9GAMM|nr:hypothetical protein DQ400_18975 [Halomonas sulfidaeris]